MSRQLSVSSTVQAAVMAVLVVGILLLLVVSGHLSEESGTAASDGERPASAGHVQDVSDLDLPGEFEPIPAAGFFQKITESQRDAGSWQVVSTAESGGQTAPPASQDVKVTQKGVDVRIAMQGSFGPVEALWVDQQFYVKGLTPRAKPWLKPDAKGRVQRLFSGLIAYSDPDQFLGELRDPASFEVVGVEDTDEGKAVRYRIGLDPASLGAGEEAAEEDTIEMDMWVDAEDRPVQVVTVSEVGGAELRSTLVYSDYGKPVELAPPPAGLVTTKLPKGLTNANP